MMTDDISRMWPFSLIIGLSLEDLYQAMWHGAHVIVLSVKEFSRDRIEISYSAKSNNLERGLGSYSSKPAVK